MWSLFMESTSGNIEMHYQPSAALIFYGPSLSCVSHSSLLPFFSCSSCKSTKSSGLKLSVRSSAFFRIVAPVSLYLLITLTAGPSSTTFASSSLPRILFNYSHSSAWVLGTLSNIHCRHCWTVYAAASRARSTTRHQWKSYALPHTYCEGFRS